MSELLEIGEVLLLTALVASVVSPLAAEEEERCQEKEKPVVLTSKKV